MQDRQLGTTYVLIRRFRAGEDSSLNELFARYQSRVERIVRVRTGPGLLGRVEVQDLVQDTLCEAFRSFDQFEMREEASLVKWLAEIAHRRILKASSYHAASKRDAHRVRSLGSGKETAASPEPAISDSRMLPPGIAARREAEEIVDRCVAELPDEWRRVILLRDYVGGDWAWVADELGRTVEAAQQLHYRVRKEHLEPLLRRAGLGTASD